MLWFFLWVMWLYLLFSTLGDILRSEDLPGVAKVGWILGVLVFPYLGVLVYVLLRGDGMAARTAQRRQRLDEALRDHLASDHGRVGELTRLAELRDRGVLNEAEFEQEKARLLT
jgi:hypothetical protein